MQILQHRIDFYKRQPIEPLLPRLLEPVKRKLPLIQPGIDHRRFERRNILLLRQLLKPSDHLLRFGPSSSERLRVAQRSQRWKKGRSGEGDRSASGVVEAAVC